MRWYDIVRLFLLLSKFVTSKGIKVSISINALLLVKLMAIRWKHKKWCWWCCFSFQQLTIVRCFAPHVLYHYIHQQQLCTWSERPVIKRGDTLQLETESKQATKELQKIMRRAYTHTYTSGAARFVCDDKLAAAAYAVFAHMNGARLNFQQETNREATSAHDHFCVCQKCAW